MLTLNHPFFITGGLLPGIRIGDCIIELDATKYNPADQRVYCTFCMRFDDGDSYVDSSLGIPSYSKFHDAFESFIDFLLACGESYPEGDNAALFPPRIAQWASENLEDILTVKFEIEWSQATGD